MNTDISVLYLLPSLVTDVALLLIMLVGLCRLRHDGGAFGLTQLLWRQVRRIVFLAGRFSFGPLIVPSFKGTHLAVDCNHL